MLKTPRHLGFYNTPFYTALREGADLVIVPWLKRNCPMLSLPAPAPKARRPELAPRPVVLGLAFLDLSNWPQYPPITGACILQHFCVREVGSIHYLKDRALPLMIISPHRYPAGSSVPSREHSGTEPPPTKVEGFSGLERLRRTVEIFSD